jgi:polyhydroxyalkanoate synthesis regulator phasin
MSDKSVGQVLLETYAKNNEGPRESYDRYMYRMYKESQNKTSNNDVVTLFNRIETLEKRVEELEKRT